MEKLMSFFQSEKRKTAKFEEEDEEEERVEPPLNDRRKWSISRSGRMKQANKKRNNVTVDLYGETFAPVERPQSLEYHVNSPSPKPPAKHQEIKPEVDVTEPKSPEEEIESAFEILDKVDKAS